MQEFIEYFDKLSEQYDLILRIEKSKYRKWEIDVFRKGYDTPFLSIRKDNKKEAFELAFTLLKIKLEDFIERSE